MPTGTMGDTGQHRGSSDPPDPGNSKRASPIVLFRCNLRSPPTILLQPRKTHSALIDVLGAALIETPLGHCIFFAVLI